MKRELKKQNKWAEFNIIDALELIDPTSTNKFLPLILKEFKNIVKTIEHSNYSFKNYANKDYNGLVLNNNGFLLNLIGDVLSVMNRENNISEILKDFNSHLNHNRVEKKDIQQYDSIEEIIEVTKKLNFEEIINASKSYIHKIVDDDKWLVVIPLTFEASLKYGASTKWCTASRDNSASFYDYTRNACLIYLINKQSGNKFGAIINNHNNIRNIELFNDADNRVDSFIAGIDAYIIELILNDFSTQTPTRDFVIERYKKIYDEFWKDENYGHALGQQPMLVANDVVNALRENIIIDNETNIGDITIGEEIDFVGEEEFIDVDLDKLEIEAVKK